MSKYVNAKIIVKRQADFDMLCAELGRMNCRWACGKLADVWQPRWLENGMFIFVRDGVVTYTGRGGEATRRFVLCRLPLYEV